MSVEVVPRELTAASAPLRDAALVLDAVAGSRRPLLDLLASVPTDQLREAAEDCLAAYELATWALAEQTADLAQRLADAGQHYAARERALAAALPAPTPRVDVVSRRAGVPLPQPAPAPVAPR